MTSEPTVIPDLHKERTALPVGELHTYHRNARQGDVGAIHQSITVNGLYRDIVVNRGTHTGRPYEVLAGNHTLKAAREAGVAEVDVTVIDVDDDHARRIVLTDNRTGDLATYDNGLLIELLQEQNASPLGLDGTGWDGDDLDDLVASEQHHTDDLDRLADEFGDPKDNDTWPTVSVRVPPDVHASWKAHVDTHSGDDVAALAALLGVPYP